MSWSDKVNQHHQSVALNLATSYNGGSMRKFIVLLATILMGTIAFGVFLFFFHQRSYLDTIDENWSLKIPKGPQEIYATDDGDSFLGDGVRFHVFMIKDNDVLRNSLTWNTNRDADMETKILDIIEPLKIDDQYYPDFNDRYVSYTKVHTDGYSTIYLIYFTESKKLTVIELIF